MAEEFRAMVVDRAGEGVAFGPRRLSVDDLPEGDVLVRVEYSSVNYKDALATSAGGKVATTYPLVPGIDLAGVVVEAPAGGAVAVGDRVVAIGYELGVSRHGGYAEFARVPQEWVAVLPDELSTFDAMTVGTAGFTAAMSAARIEAHGVVPKDGPVLVTGASGGVGSSAVALLAALGYEVVASTGKASARELLTELGAGEIIDRSELDVDGRPLGRQKWAAAVDCVGGRTLATVLSEVRYGGIVAASGLTGGAALPTTVLPFILRGVTLAGIDSVQQPIEQRRQLWARLGADLRPAVRRELADEVALADVGEAIARIRKGAAVGRTVVRVAEEA